MPSTPMFLAALLLAGCVVEPELAATSDELARGKFLRLPGGIGSQYIVVLGGAPDASLHANTHAAIDRLAASHRASVHARYTAALRGFAATMTEEDAIALADDPDVELVQPVLPSRGDAVQSNVTWGIDRIDQLALPLDSKYDYGADGSGVTAYIIDSGTRPSHSEFTGRLLPGFSSVNDGNGTTDCHMHGTHTMGTVGGSLFGVAKKANIVPVRVLDCNNAGNTNLTVAGIDWIIANKRPNSVANLSLGGPPDPALDLAVRNLIASGVLTVVSAGNNNVDACGQSPAREPEAITVAASDKTDRRASFSNYGACVDVFAPGVDIQAASIAGDTLIRTLSGTSMSAPHVTGIAALYRSAHPGATQAQFRAALIEAASLGQIGDPQGSPNLLATARMVTPAPKAAIASPADGAVVGPDFTVTADITGSAARVELAIDGRVVETKTAGPYTFAIKDLASGNHTLVVKADDGGNRSSTTTIAVRVSASGGGGADEGGELDGTVYGGCSIGSDGGARGGGAGGGLVMIATLALIRRRRR